MSFGLTYSLYNKLLPVSLRNVSVEAYVVDMIAEVKVIQTYKNVETSTIKASYKFPINESAAVCAFEAEIDGKKIQGVVKEVQEGVIEYNDMNEKGHSAFLLEERHADIFECSVGSILPEQIVIIKFSYVVELKHDEETEKIRFVLPTAIAPKYGIERNIHCQDFVGFGVSSFVKPELSLLIECKMTSVITNIESPSHFISCEININGNPKISRITLGEQINYLDKDFVLIIKSLSLDQPRAFIEHNPEKDTKCLMLTLVPKFAVNPVLTELIFIVDRSESMYGSSIKKASAALELLLQSLPEDCYFNIVSFGERVDPLFKQSEPNSPSSLSVALLLARTMVANYGGKEIYQVLKWGFENKRTNIPTAIFLITDGNVWNVEEISELVNNNVKKYEDKVRLFVLGIGSNVSTNLVESLARAGKGYAQYVTDTEKMDKKLLGMLKNGTKSQIKDYRINWSDDINIIDEPFENSDKKIKDKPIISFFNDDEISSSEQSLSYDFVDNIVIRQAPYEIPQIYSGVRFIVYCMMPKDFTAKKSIILSAMSQDGPMKLEIPVDPIVLKGSKIHTLAARKLIQNLEDGTSYIHNHPKFRGKPVPASIIRKQIIALGKTFNLVSKYTSFLAVDEHNKMNDEKENNDKVILFKKIGPNRWITTQSETTTQFGATAQAHASPFGAVTTQMPAFGFRAAATQASASGNLGATTTQTLSSGFGTATRSPTVGGFGFGTPITQQFGVATQVFGFGTATTKSSAIGGFGFGMPITQVLPFGTVAPAYGFGATSITQAFPSGTIAPAFGFGAAAISSGGFAPGGFGVQPSGFGFKLTTSSGGFGVSLSQPSGLGLGAAGFNPINQSWFGNRQSPVYGGFQAQPFDGINGVPNHSVFGGINPAQSQPSYGMFPFAQQQPVYGGFGFAQTTANYGGFGLPALNLFQPQSTFGSFHLPQPQLIQSQPFLGNFATQISQNALPYNFNIVNPIPFGFNTNASTLSLLDNLNTTSSIPPLFVTPSSATSLFVLPSSTPSKFAFLNNLIASSSLGILGTTPITLQTNNNTINDLKPFFGFEIKKELGEGSTLTTMITANNDNKKFDSKVASFDGLMTYLKFQSFDGIFRPTFQFYSFFGKNNPMQDKPSEYGDESWCTSVSIAYLEIVMWKDFRQECEMSYERANRALKKLMESDDIKEILDKAKDWINKWLVKKE
ncbi:von Willebrand factor A domain-containing protein DDB_G0267758-like [Rhizophagus clarus]|nr:von Willebrand factor A domain-containing protein DDB_G0267758-like [Rhizophagus clarus]